MGTPTASVSHHIANVQKLLAASGVKYSMHSAGTTLEGTWEEGMCLTVYLFSKYPVIPLSRGSSQVFSLQCPPLPYYPIYTMCIGITHTMARPWQNSSFPISFVFDYSLPCNKRPFSNYSGIFFGKLSLGFLKHQIIQSFSTWDLRGSLDNSLQFLENYKD